VLVERELVVGVDVEVPAVGELVRAPEFARRVRRVEVRAPFADFLGDGDGEFVGVRSDGEDDVVALLDARAPVDEHFGVVLDAGVHTRHFAQRREKAPRFRNPAVAAATRASGTAWPVRDSAVLARYS
jgi:hypothetical protein